MTPAKLRRLRERAEFYATSKRVPERHRNFAYLVLELLDTIGIEDGDLDGMEERLHADLRDQARAELMAAAEAADFTREWAPMLRNGLVLDTYASFDRKVANRDNDAMKLATRLVTPWEEET